ncbi:MAG: SSU ribosomal protein S12P methylthiotransferase [bacterium P3]|nr:MAG: SSU ribosomal protein S12P methylthiotransferase [bacterium P201]KWW30469.1 MAG: SSU ribosomal protein S12P methylthiotransferase [bacterium P3]KWW41356.1 MAG: SSU ribosomal protein S12P methylthiotransferase [bacterium F083]
MKINIVTLGCSKNTVDSENLAGHLQQQQHQLFFDRTLNDCDVVIVNTCGFIGDAKQESVTTLLEQVDAKRRFNRRHRYDGRRRQLIATGCLVQRYREELRSELPEVDAWFGVMEWDKVLTAVDKAASKEPFSLRRTVSTPRHYAYLKIAEGCNRSCSYCAIPLIRGAYVSRPIEELVAEARQLVADGAKELIVIAQDTTYYGLDRYGRRRLAELLELLATRSGARWIRLHYTYPADFPLDVLDVMRRYSNICKYIDIPLQHINSGLLRSMRRGIDRTGTLALLQQIRKTLPDICIRTTLIAGYPGETDEAFEELKTFVQEARFDRMGCFAYSPEEGTPAEPLGDPVDEAEKQRRVDELMTLQERISQERNEQLAGKTLTVLIDRREGDFYIGRTEYDSPEIDDEVLIDRHTVPHHTLHTGSFYRVRITAAMENDLYGTVVHDA